MVQNKKDGSSRARPAKRSKREDWGSANVLENPNGPLAKISLKEVFSNPAAFGALNEEQKTKLASLIPANKAAISVLDGQLSMSLDFVKHDTDFQHALGRFQEDITEGRFDREWLRQATKASEKRIRGDFDAFKDAEFEEYWGQKQNLPTEEVNGSSNGKQRIALTRKIGLQKGDIRATASNITDGIDGDAPLQEMVEVYRHSKSNEDE